MNKTQNIEKMHFLQSEPSITLHHSHSQPHTLIPITLTLVASAGGLRANRKRIFAFVIHPRRLSRLDGLPHQLLRQRAALVVLVGLTLADLRAIDQLQGCGSVCGLEKEG